MEKIKIFVPTIVLITLIGVVILYNQNNNNEFPPWVNSETGPWKSNVIFATSEDGLHFTKTGKLLVERASVPNMVTDYSKGRIIAIYQYFSFEKEEEFNKIAVSFSQDDGETWTKPQVITYLGLPEPLSNPVDPTLVLLDDGKYRLYFCYPQPQPNVYPPPRILSAISEDCINFTVEAGVRVMVEGKTVNDPAVVKIEGKWHYYSPVFNEQGNNYHAVSEDGLNFTLEENIVFDVNMLGCALAVDDGYRFYGSGGEGRSSAFSADGYNWVQEDVRMPGPDPGVIKLQDGSYLMLCITFT